MTVRQSISSMFVRIMREDDRQHERAIRQALRCNAYTAMLERGLTPMQTVEMGVEDRYIASLNL